jgi:tRNA threonylcarbamoyladenosine biosynthesis protein TsaB
MKLLAIDCSAALCAACIFDAGSGEELGRAVEDIGKGHAERLMAVVEDAMREAGTTYADLGAIAVSVGPGSFTGIRVAISAARGFALALSIPAIGISTLEAIAAESRTLLGERPIFVALASGPDRVQCAGYDAAGRLWHEPSLIETPEAAELVRGSGAALAGTGAASIAAALDGLALDMGSQAATADIAVYARLALAHGSSGEKPRPLYLREPDAKPQAGFILERAADPAPPPAERDVVP